jgi:hypothetical protein
VNPLLVSRGYVRSTQQEAPHLLNRALYCRVVQRCPTRWIRRISSHGYSLHTVVVECTHIG